VGRQHLRFRDDDITIAEWVGEFAPASIKVIPLFEDVASMLRAADIVSEYLADKRIEDQRVFLARSDTAMNFGLVSAALANKIALARLEELSDRTGVRIHPILGMGSAPFRGGLSPLTAERVGREYPSVVTFSIQSSFKFDYSVDQVRDALRFADIDGPLMTPSLREALGRAGFEIAPDSEHLSIVRRMRTEMERSDAAQVGDLVLRAALVRRFIG
jgi:phosphoenolpyruvate carboxylase